MAGFDPREVLPLTALRALAAWWVVAFHSPATSSLTPGPVARGLTASHRAADVFFVPGFILPERYRNEDRGRPPSARSPH